MCKEKVYLSHGPYIRFVEFLFLIGPTRQEQKLKDIFSHLSISDEIINNHRPQLANFCDSV